MHFYGLLVLHYFRHLYQGKNVASPEKKNEKKKSTAILQYSQLEIQQLPVLL